MQESKNLPQNWERLPKQQKAELIQLLEEKQKRRIAQKTVYGIVCPKDGLVRCWQEQNGVYVQVDDIPHIEVPLKLEPAILIPKSIKVIDGGRGGGKSESVSAIMAARVKDYGLKLGCFREYQNSISDSVHSIISKKITNIGMPGFDIQESKVLHEGGGSIKYRGLARNPEGVKSMDGFGAFWVEEAQTTSERSLELLEPTLREEGGEIWYTLNRGSSEDPISKEHLVPYEAALLADGYYEDDDIMVIIINHGDNPWFPDNLEQKRLKNKQVWPAAKYDHVWNGAYNDTVDDALISTDWFDACIDAHLKLGIKPLGMKFAAHDPSDEGSDSKGYAMRHGSVFLDIQEKTTGNVNEGCDWATGLAVRHSVDSYAWDGDGMGVALARQTAKAFGGKPVNVVMFRGSESPDTPDAIYDPCTDHAITGRKTCKESFRNKRAQYYQELRDRCYNTFRAVEHGDYIDPDKMVSFSSDIKLINKLRAEVCRMPIKPNGNGLIELYTKQVMKDKFKVASPNLADSVMMCLRNTVRVNKTPVMPRPLQTMGRR